MAIEWTNNSTDNLNLWNQNDTATWTVTDNGDVTTGVIPDWIRTGDHDDKPQFYFANTRERTMMVGQGVDTPGDVYRGENGQVSYDAETNTLTISEPLEMELNNWTVQVTQTSGSGVFRWPGWGATTDAWADPGCHAWDLNEGDQTHLIRRTFELEGDDGFSSADELDQTQSGVWRVSYALTGTSSSTRDVTLTLENTSESFERRQDETDTTQIRLPEAYTSSWGTGTCTNRATNIFGPYTMPGSDQATGNMLGVSSFYLDDCGFIVPAEDDDDWDYSRDVSNRNITLPAWRCLMVVSNYTSLMSGAIDGGGCRYTHAGQSYSHGNVAASAAAQGLRDIGVPVIAYNDLSLRYLIRLGFVNDAGEFSCRLLHDGQGCGGITITWDIPAFG